MGFLPGIPSGYLPVIRFEIPLNFQSRISLKVSTGTSLREIFGPPEIPSEGSSGIFIRFLSGIPSGVSSGIHPAVH